MKAFALPAALLALTGTALLLGPVAGAGGTGGPTRQEVRQVAPFTQVQVHGGLHAQVSIQKDQHVELSGDEDRIPLVSTTVRNGILLVEPRDHANLEGRWPLVRIAAPLLSAVGASGASEVEATGLGARDLALSATGASRLSAAGLSGDRLVVKASGASWVTLKGQGKVLQAELSGASGLRAREVRTEAVTLKASGACQAEVCTTKSLNADLSGASHLDYYCGATQVQQRATGASSISSK